MQECKHLHVNEWCSAVEFSRPPTARCLLKLTSQCHAFRLVFVGFIRVKSTHMFRSYHGVCDYSKTLHSMARLCLQGDIVAAALLLHYIL